MDENMVVVNTKIDKLGRELREELKKQDEKQKDTNDLIVLIRQKIISDNKKKTDIIMNSEALSKKVE
jgi:hypothetical protein